MSGEDNINNNSTDNGFWTSTKRGTEEITIQQKKLQRIDADAKGAHHEQTQHMLNMIMADPEKLKRDEFDYLRQFLATVIHNLDKFKFDIGDDRGTVALDDKENKSKLTIGYIDCVARRKDTSSLAKEPILQVVERETKYRNSINVTKDKNGNCAVQMQFTHLILCDGDGNIIVGRVVAHLTHVARKLVPGDIIQLPLFTELTHRMGTSAPMPAVFIADFRKVSYGPLPKNLKKEPIICDVANRSNDATDQSTTDEERNGGNLQKDVSNAKCEYGKRLCSVHGVEMIGCICDLHKVTDLNLQTLKEDCYFAKDEVKDMTESQKRCMIYWWYATNIYSICGKKHRMKLPDCLVNAVRTAYPEESGIYEGFCFNTE